MGAAPRDSDGHGFEAPPPPRLRARRAPHTEHGVPTPPPPPTYRGTSRPRLWTAAAQCACVARVLAGSSGPTLKTSAHSHTPTSGWGDALGR